MRNTVKRYNKRFKGKRENGSLYKSLIIPVPYSEYKTTDSRLNFQQLQFNRKGHITNLYLWIYNSLSSMVRHPIGADSTPARKTFWRVRSEWIPSHSSAQYL